MENVSTRLSSEDAADAKALLRDAAYLYLAMVEPTGPYVVPLNFAYVAKDEGEISEGRDPDSASLGGLVGSALDGRIYFHTGEGRKTEALAADPRVCLAVTAELAFDQGDGPCADGFSYRSLLLWGRAQRIEERDRREMALRWIVAKYDPAAVDVPFNEEDLARTQVYEVGIETAAYKQQPPRTSS